VSIASGAGGRYPSDTHIYEQFAPRLKSFFEPYGFVEDRWQWLIRHCNHNLHDLVGLISILLEKRIFPLEAEPPLTAEMHEESLTSLLEEFLLHAEGQLRDRLMASGGYAMELKFMCPMCGSQDLRTKFLEPYYPISTLDRIKVDPAHVVAIASGYSGKDTAGDALTSGAKGFIDKPYDVRQVLGVVRAGLDDKMEPEERLD
jgi:hypothetical protein